MDSVQVGLQDALQRGRIEEPRPRVGSGDDAALAALDSPERVQGPIEVEEKQHENYAS